MPHLRFSVDINAPVEKVFAFHADFNNALKIIPPEAEVQVVSDNTRVYPGAHIC